MKSYFSFDFEQTKVFIAEKDGFITRLTFSKDKIPLDYCFEKTPLIESAAQQLDEYFSGKRQNFDLPLCFEGTSFQKQVWQQLTKIPYGTTKTYAQIAIEVGNQKAVRAVGLANNKNPIAIIAACHRVIGANGSLVGYAGGLELKQKLLDLENGLSRKINFCV